MKKLFLFLVWGVRWGGEALSLRLSLFLAAKGGAPTRWRTWSPRPEVAPAAFADDIHDRGLGGLRAISGNTSFALHGGWANRVAGISGGPCLVWRLTTGTMARLGRAAAVCFSLTLSAAGPQVVPLYPSAAPGSETWNWSETERVSTDGLRRVANVARPTLTVYPPGKDKTGGTAVVICPGGGFRHLAILHEGEDVARWLNAQGVTAFVLKYRLMRTGDEGEKDEGVMARRRAEVIPQAVADGLEAIRLVRRRAVEWGVRKDRIGILGFSAGGWVATAVTLQGRDDSRPDFSVPVYATMPENMIVPAAPPPIFLVHADDDASVQTTRTTIRLYCAWKQAGGSAELHIYSRGGHGFGMRRQASPVDTWPFRLRDWMAARDLLAPDRAQPQAQTAPVNRALPDAAARCCDEGEWPRRR